MWIFISPCDRQADRRQGVVGLFGHGICVGYKWCMRQMIYVLCWPGRTSIKYDTASIQVNIWKQESKLNWTVNFDIRFKC